MTGESAVAAAAQGRCFLCDLLAREVAWRENGYEALACRCGLTFVSPPPRPGAVDPAYDAHSASFYRLPAAAKVAWLRRTCPGGRLLEIGCGEGWFLDAARRAGFDAHGIDAHPRRSADACARGLAVRHGLFEEARIDERFDVVAHCDLLSHFPEPIAALAKMRRLLTADGVLFFEVGVLGASVRQWYPRIGGIGLPQHRWLYSDAALGRLFAAAGLEVVATRRFGLGPAVWLSHSLRRVAPVLRRWMTSPPAPVPTPVTPAAPAPRRGWRRWADQAQERVESFARYQVGAWTPRLGPATLLVVAQPVERAP